MNRKESLDKEEEFFQFSPLSLADEVWNIQICKAAVDAIGEVLGNLENVNKKRLAKERKYLFVSYNFRNLKQLVIFSNFRLISTLNE